jgi:hypothetical protein
MWRQRLRSRASSSAARSDEEEVADDDNDDHHHVDDNESGFVAADDHEGEAAPADYYDDDETLKPSWAEGDFPTFKDQMRPVGVIMRRINGSDRPSFRNSRPNDDDNDYRVSRGRNRAVNAVAARNNNDENMDGLKHHDVDGDEENDHHMVATAEEATIPLVDVVTCRTDSDGHMARLRALERRAADADANANAGRQAAEDRLAGGVTKWAGQCQQGLANMSSKQKRIGFLPWS